MEEARAQLKEKIGTCTPDEFAYGEQQLKGTYTDEEITHRMDDLLALFDGILVRANNEFPKITRFGYINRKSTPPKT